MHRYILCSNRDWHIVHAELMFVKLVHEAF